MRKSKSQESLSSIPVSKKSFQDTRGSKTTRHIPIVESKSCNGSNETNTTDLIDDYIDYTPRSEFEKSVYRYYCPICFRFARTIMSTADCCENQLCLQCALNFTSAIEKHATEPHSAPCDCPFCGEPFNPKVEAAGAPPRQYHDENYQSPCIQFSPVAVGDSFNELKRKMVLFDSVLNKSEHSSHIEERSNNDDDDLLTVESEEEVTQAPSLNDSLSLFEQSFDHSESVPLSHTALDESSIKAYLRCMPISDIFVRSVIDSAIQNSRQ